MSLWGRARPGSWPEGHRRLAETTVEAYCRAEAGLGVLTTGNGAPGRLREQIEEPPLPSKMPGNDGHQEKYPEPLPSAEVAGEDAGHFAMGGGRGQAVWGAHERTMPTFPAGPPNLKSR